MKAKKETLKLYSFIHNYAVFSLRVFFKGIKQQFQKMIITLRF